MIERYLNEFLLEEENDKLLTGTVDDVSKENAGVTKIDDIIYAVPYKATGKAKGKEIGYGHVVTPEEEDGFLTFRTKDNEVYTIDYSDDIKLTQTQAKDLARNDAIKHRNSAREAIKNFDSLPEELKIVATDYDYNIGPGAFKNRRVKNTNNEIVTIGPEYKNFKKALENLDFGGMMEEYKRYTNVKRDKDNNVISKDEMGRNEPTADLINQARGKIIDMLSYKKGGMVDRDPYKRQPRFI